MRLRLLFTTIILSVTASLFSQDSYPLLTGTETEPELLAGPLKESALNVFLDCRWCDKDYIKRTIPFVNYVNNKDEADVHILVTRRVTGGGGGEYKIEFIGMGDFSEVQDELMFYSPIDETADETRTARSGMISMGLMQFVARTPLGRNIIITFEEEDIPQRVLNPEGEEDPWNSWMFRLRANGNFNKDENYETTRLTGSLSTDKITPDIKFEFDLNYSYRQTIYSSNLNKSYRENWSIRSLFVKSLGPKWSAGVRASLSGDTYYNNYFNGSFGPALEYNLFPYEESSKRQVRVQYGINFNQVNYIDTTIYLKTNERLFAQYLSVAIGFNQQWGSASLSATWSNYLHDFEENNLSIRGRINYRIYKGLSVNFEPRASLIHNQRYIPKGSVSAQDVLTKQLALKTGYSYSFQIGLTYSFGSIYNNVVNPRFGN